jgi:hypothetical protein
MHTDTPPHFRNHFLDGSGEDFSAQKCFKWKWGRLDCTNYFLMEVEKTFITISAVKVLILSRKGSNNPAKHTVEWGNVQRH